MKIDRYIKYVLKLFAGEEGKRKIDNFFGGNKIKVVPGSRLQIGDALMRGCTIEIFGKNSHVELGWGNRLINCRIQVFGDECRINLGKNNILEQAWFWLEDTGSSIIVGDDNRMTGSIQLAAIEGNSVEIGDDNLFSRDIQISNGDSHSIIDVESGRRINPSRDIKIGTHNWFGMHATICKGVTISHDVIVGRGAIVTSPVLVPNVAVAGVPAKVVKECVTWRFERK